MMTWRQRIAKILWCSC